MEQQDAGAAGLAGEGSTVALNQAEPVKSTPRAAASAHRSRYALSWVDTQPIRQSGWRAPALVAGDAVDQLADQVSVPVVPSVFLDHVQVDPA